jgi:signal transduction histidine kinase
MTAEEISRCTEPFWKADPARTRASGGAGLGLTICRAITRLHSAELEIRSEPGRGTTVEFTLPLQSGEDSETALPVS